MGKAVNAAVRVSAASVISKLVGHVMIFISFHLDFVLYHGDAPPDQFLDTANDKVSITKLVGDDPKLRGVNVSERLPRFNKC